MPLSRSFGTFPEAGSPAIGAQPLDTRLALAALIAGGGAGLAVRPGVFAGAPVALVVGTDGWAYRLRSAHFATSRSAHDGAHIFANDGDQDAATDAAPGTPGASRIDILYVVQPSNTENGDTTSTPVFGVAIGDASTGVPNPPAIPAGAMELARNTMTSAATSTSSAGNTITQTWQYTALRGAPIPVRNAAERDELNPLVSATNHLEVDRLDTGQLERNTGTGWSVLDPAMIHDTGWVALAKVAPWADYNVANYGVAAYRKIGRTVFLQGMVTGVSAPPNVIATLPAGVRPEVSIRFPAEITTAPGFGVVRVFATGEIRFEAASGAAAYVSLGQVSFSVPAA